MVMNHYWETWSSAGVLTKAGMHQWRWSDNIGIHLLRREVRFKLVEIGRSAILNRRAGVSKRTKLCKFWKITGHFWNGQCFCLRHGGRWTVIWLTSLLWYRSAYWFQPQFLPLTASVFMLWCQEINRDCLHIGCTLSLSCLGWLKSFSLKQLRHQFLRN